MSRPRLWIVLAGAGALLLNAPRPRAAAVSAGEPSALTGTTGHSVEHALVDLTALAREARAAGISEEIEQVEKEPSKVLPKKLPIPAGATIRRDVRGPRPEVAENLRLASPPLASSFQAVPDDGHTSPPDTEGAVGPNHVFTTHNTQFRVQDRTGRELLTLGFASFWSKVLNGLDLSDPKVLYEPFIDRWVTTAVAGFDTKDASILLGVSQTGDPTGTWNLYRVDVDPEDKLWADFPALGFNKNWIAIQVNMFTNVDSNGKRFFSRSQLYVFDKANLVAGGTDARHTLFTFDQFGGRQVPAATYDADQPVLYVLEDWNGDDNGKGSVLLFSVSGPVGSEVFQPLAFAVTDAAWDDIPPNGSDFAPQQGSAVKIAANDADFTHVAFRNGLITAAQTIFLPAGGAPQWSAVQWWQLTTDASIVQRGRIEDPTGQTFYTFPTIAANTNNDLLVGYGVFSSQQFASAGYAFRAAADSQGTMRDGAILKSGEAGYARIGSGRNRWGDYSATLVDPINGLDFWSIQEYAARPAAAGTSAWATWWGRVIPDSGPAVPLPSAAFSAPATAVAGANVAFTDTSSGATQWFWNFGDGTTSTNRSPTHVFLISGTFPVTQAAVNQTGASYSTRMITIAQPLKANPVAGAPRSRAPRAITPRR